MEVRNRQNLGFGNLCIKIKPSQNLIADKDKIGRMAYDIGFENFSSLATKKGAALRFKDRMYQRVDKKAQLGLIEQLRETFKGLKAVYTNAKNGKTDGVYEKMKKSINL